MKTSSVGIEVAESYGVFIHSLVERIITQIAVYAKYLK